MDKHPSFERIIGGTQEQKEIVERQAEKASSKSGKELFGDHIVEPTVEEQKVIDSAVEYANELAHQYGAKKRFGTDRIFLLEPDSIKEISEGEITQAFCNRINQSIGVERACSNALLAMSIFHEVLHLNAYGSAQVCEYESDESIVETGNRPYRSGITMRGRNEEGKYFYQAEEAIVTTLSKKYFDEVLSQDPLYKEEVERTKEIKQWLIEFAERRLLDDTEKNRFIAGVKEILIIPNNEELYNTLLSNEHDDNKFRFFCNSCDDEFKSGRIFFEREMEREKLNEVLDTIVEASEGWLSRDELFDQFAHAHFTGNYLPLARTIEEVMGKGSFRKIAEELGVMK